MDTDLDLCAFYSAFFQEHLKLNKDRNLRKFKRFLKPEQKFENDDSGRKESEILEQDFYREKFAYLFENSVFTSSAVAVLFKELLDKNANLLVRLIEQDVISICCFSDGTCAEIVAIVLVLANASRNVMNHIRFNLTVICSAKSWKNFSLKVLKSLEKNNLIEHVKFISINVSEELPEETQQVIRNADIVTMVKFLSTIQNCRRRFSAVYKDIFQHLLPESIIFFLDGAYTNFFYGISNQLSSFKKLYYKTTYLHIVNLETVKNSFKPFPNAFENYFFIKMQKICFGFWSNVERSAKGTDIFSVFKVENLSLKTERRAGKKIENSTSLHHNLTKSNVVASSKEESSLSKNCTFSGKSNTSLEPIADAWTNTEPFSKLEKTEYHQEKGIIKKKIKPKSQRDEANNTDASTENSFGLLEQPVLTRIQEKKRRNEKRRIQTSLDKLVATNIADQKHQVTPQVLTVEEKRNYGDGKSNHVTTLKSLKFQKKNRVESEKSLKRQERVESIRFSQTQRNRDDNVWNTETNKIQWKEFEERKMNTKEILQGVSVSKTKSLNKKSENILISQIEVDSQKKKRRKRKCRNQPTLDKMTSNVTRQKQQNMFTRVFPKNNVSSGDCKSCHPATLESLELQNIDMDERGEPLKTLTRQENWALSSENTLFPQTQRNGNNNSWGTEANKREWTKFEGKAVNTKQNLYNISDPDYKKSHEKNENILAHDVPIDSQRKRKEKRSRKLTLVKTTVSNIAEQKHQSTPKQASQNVERSNEDCRSGHQATLKSPALQDIDTDQSEKSLKRQKNLALFCKNIRFPLIERKRDNNSWSTETKKTEWAECEERTLNIEVKPNQVFIPKTEELYEKSENILTNEVELDSQKKKSRRKGKRRIKPTLDKTVSNIAEHTLQNIPKGVSKEARGNIGDCKSCHPTALKSLELQNNDTDESEETLMRPENMPLFDENIRLPQTQRNRDYNIWSSETTKIEWVEYEETVISTKEVLHDSSVPKIEALFERNKKITSHQVQFDSQRKRMKKQKCRKQLSIAKMVSNTAEQKHQDILLLPAQHDRKNDGDNRNCLSKTLISSKVQKIDNSRSKELLKSHDYRLLFAKNVKFPQNRNCISDNTWDTVSNEIEWAGNEITVNNRDKKLHNAFDPEIEALCEKNKNMLTQQVELDHLVLPDQFLEIGNDVYPSKPNIIFKKTEYDNGEIQTYPDPKPTKISYRFNGKQELFYEMSNNKSSSGNSPTKKGWKFETNEKQNPFSNILRQKLTENETCNPQTAPSLVPTKRAWYPSQRALTERKRFESLDNNTKLFSFANSFDQKSAKSETGIKKFNHKSLTAVTNSHFLPQKEIDTKQAENFETDSMTSIMNCLNQPFPKKETYNGQSVTSTVSKPKPHPLSQNQKPSKIKIAVENLQKNGKNERNNKENIFSSKSGTEPCTDFFDPEKQRRDNVYLKQEQKTIQATTPEKAFYLPNIAYIGDKIIVTKECDKKFRINSLLNNSSKSSKRGFSYRGQDQTEQRDVLELKETMKEETHEEFNEEVSKEFNENVSRKFNEEVSKEFNEEVSKEFNEEVSKEFNEEVSKEFNEEVSKEINEEFQHCYKDMKFVEPRPKKVSILENEEAMNKFQHSDGRLEFPTLPQVLLKKKKKKKGTGIAKKKKKASKGKKKKKASEAEVVPYKENMKFECINKDFSLITLAADYANTLLTKINLIYREDIVENRTFIKVEKVRQKLYSESTDRIFDDFVHDSNDGDLDWFVPAFNQNSTKNLRWDFW